MEWHKKLENKKLQKYFCCFAGGVKCVWKRIFTEVVARGVGEHERYAAAKWLYPDRWNAMFLCRVFPPSARKVSLISHFKSADKSGKMNFLKRFYMQKRQARVYECEGWSRERYVSAGRTSLYGFYRPSCLLPYVVQYPHRDGVCDDRWHKQRRRPTQLTFLFFVQLFFAPTSNQCWIMMRPMSLSTALFNVRVDILIFILLFYQYRHVRHIHTQAEDDTRTKNLNLNWKTCPS